MKRPVLPQSRARTAYGLLSEIAALALKEPKRIAMGVWCWKGLAGTKKFVESSLVDEMEVTFPACGIVGCIGGWTETLRPGCNAWQRLGLNQAQGHELFRPNLVYDIRQQTPWHARATVRHIRRFQQKYRAQLLAKKVSR